MSKTDVISPEWAKEVNKIRHSESKVADITQKELALVELAELPVWNNIKGYLESRIRELRGTYGGDLEKDSYEVIGQKAFVFRIIEDEFEGFINLVENTRTAFKKEEAKKDAVHKSRSK